MTEIRFANGSVIVIPEQYGDALRYIRTLEEEKATLRRERDELHARLRRLGYK